LADIAAQLADLQAQINTMNGTRGVTVERAQVTATGGSQCTVTYPGGQTRVLPYATSYTPTVGDQVKITNSPAWSGIDCKVSA
jgi:hypothetical protein